MRLEGNNMPEDIKYDRRRFFGSAAMTFVAAKLAMIDSAQAQSSMTKPADATRDVPLAFTFG